MCQIIVIRSCINTKYAVGIREDQELFCWIYSGMLSKKKKYGTNYKYKMVYITKTE